MHRDRKASYCDSMEYEDRKNFICDWYRPTLHSARKCKSIFFPIEPMMDFPAYNQYGSRKKNDGHFLFSSVD